MSLIFKSKLLPDMLKFEKYGDGKGLIQKFHDRYE